MGTHRTWTNEQAQEAVRLYFNEQLSQTEVAERMGCSKMLVWSMLTGTGHTLRTHTQAALIYKSRMSLAKEDCQRTARDESFAKSIYDFTPEHPPQIKVWGMVATFDSELEAFRYAYVMREWPNGMILEKTLAGLYEVTLWNPTAKVRGYTTRKN